MPLVKVWNENKYPYKETFKDQEIAIPAGGYIEMEYYDAHEFRGSFKAPKLDFDNNPMPESFKMIRVEEPGSAPEAKSEEFVCIVCKFKASSQAELDKHMKEAHAELAVVDEEAEKAMKSRKKAG